MPTDDLLVSWVGARRQRMIRHYAPLNFKAALGVTALYSRGSAVEHRATARLHPQC